MNLVLSPVEIRVLGCLIEKELTTPAYYPLTLNALVAACNQKSNRDPAMSVDETALVRALDALRYDHHLGSQVTTSGNRVPKYRHEMLARYSFSGEQMAILCELFVRGPQTTGELRTRVARFNSFPDLSKLEEAIQGLVQFQDGPYIVLLPRERGRREPRWAHLFGGEISVAPESAELTPEPARLVVMGENERITTLETRVTELTARLDELAGQLAHLNAELGGNAPNPAPLPPQKNTLAAPPLPGAP